MRLPPSVPVARPAGRAARRFADTCGRTGESARGITSPSSAPSTVRRARRDTSPIDSATTLWRKDFPNVDGVFAITHKGGCGLPFEGPDHHILERVLAGFRQSSQRCGLRDRRARLRGRLRAASGRRRRTWSRWGRRKRTVTKAPVARPRMLNIQEEGGITRTVEAAVRAVYELMPEANSWQRTEQPASKISLAMECGGSDGNSGVTANPALGVAADLLVAQGGTAVSGRDHRDLRRRALAHPAGSFARGRSEAGRPDQVVGMVHRHLRRTGSTTTRRRATRRAA